MKRISLLILVASIVVVPAKAQTFTVGTFTDDSILSIIGSASNEIAGANFGNGPTVTINGYTLTSAVAGGSVDPIDLSNFVNTYNGFLGGNGNGTLTTTGNSDFDSVVGTGSYGGSTAGLTLNNLTAGTYEVLVLSDDDRSVGNGGQNTTLTDNGLTSDPIFGGFPGGTGNPSSPGAGTNQFEGAYLTDTFTVAPGETSHDITFHGSYVNAVLVESVSTPEPSTYALLGLGALALLVISRRAVLKN